MNQENNQIENGTERPSVLDTAVELSQQPNSIFRRALLGGYKIQDVDHYVERAADVLEQLIKENRELRVELDELRETETSLRTALGTAHKFAQNMTNTAKRETATLLAQVRSAATEVSNIESLNPRDALASSIEALRAHRDRLNAELSATLESHIRLLDTVESNAPTDDVEQKIQAILSREVA